MAKDSRTKKPKKTKPWKLAAGAYDLHYEAPDGTLKRVRATQIGAAGPGQPYLEYDINHTITRVPWDRIWMIDHLLPPSAKGPPIKLYREYDGKVTEENVQLDPSFGIGPGLVIVHNNSQVTIPWGRIRLVEMG